MEVRQLDNTVVNNQWSDGDGQVIKRVKQNVNASPSITTTYYVRSNALGGRVIAEVNSAGQKQKRNIYLGGKVLASEGVGGAISWKHDDPLTGSQGESVAGGGYSPVAEYDPSGVNIGLAAPSGGELFEAEVATLIESSTAGVNRCSSNSLEFDCEWMAMALKNGILGVQDARLPVDGGKPGSVLPLTLRLIGGSTVFVQSDDSILVRADLDNKSVTVRPAGGHFEALPGGGSLMGSLNLLPQTPLVSGLSAKQERIFRQAADRIAQKDCAQWFEETMRTLLKLKKSGKLSAKDMLAGALFASSGKPYELKELFKYAYFTKYNPDVYQGLSASDISKFESNVGLAVTTKASGYRQVILHDNIFRRDEDSWPWQQKVNIDTAGHIVHELFHVAGFSDNLFKWFKVNNQSLNNAIHEHCGLPGTTIQ